MAGPTQTKPTRGYEGTSVPVLFSLKNVQPLLLSAAQNSQSSAPPSVANPSQQKTVAPSLPVTQPVTSQEDNTKQPVRRTSLMSRIVTTSFLVLLVFVVLKYSIPKAKTTTDLATSSSSSDVTTQSTSSITSPAVTGPTTLVANRPSPDLPSMPSNAFDNQNGFTLSNEQSSSAPTQGEPSKLDAPSIPPMLLSSPAPKQQVEPSLNNGRVLYEPVLNLGNTTSERTSANANPQGANQPYIPLNLDQMPSSYVPVGVGNPASPPQANPKLNIVNTPTPESSISEFESLYRAATQLQSQTPSRTVSAGQIDGRGPTSASTPSIPMTGESYPIDRNANAPLSIPEYERSLNGSNQNRYQPIRQPVSMQRSGVSTTPSPVTQTQIPAQPTPYKPVGGTLTQPQSGTSVGYPPIPLEPK